MSTNEDSFEDPDVHFEQLIKFIPKANTKTGFRFKLDGNVLKSENTISDQLMNRAHHFLDNIPLNNDRPNGNVLWNMYDQGVQITCRNSLPTDWKWHQVDSNTWRLAPLTPEDFVHYPISSLISTVEAKWRKTRLSDFNFNNLQTINWFIERKQPNVAKERDLLHDFDFTDRTNVTVYFILYLSDWSEADGGEITNRYYPKRNTMIVFDTEKSNFRNRWISSLHNSIISLVGFCKIPKVQFNGEEYAQPA